MFDFSAGKTSGGNSPNMPYFVILHRGSVNGFPFPFRELEPLPVLVQQAQLRLYFESQSGFLIGFGRDIVFIPAAIQEPNGRFGDRGAGLLFNGCDGVRGDLVPRLQKIHGRTNHPLCERGHAFHAFHLKPEPFPSATGPGGDTRPGGWSHPAKHLALQLDAAA